MATPETGSSSLSLASVERDITWIRGHVIVALLAVALIVGSIIGGVGLFESLIEKHDARVAAAQLQKEGVDTATQAALLAQLEQDRTANAQRDATQAALIQSLITQMAQQRAATAKQVTQDSTLDLQSAAQRLADQTNYKNGDIGIKDGLVTMSLPATRTVVADLDLYVQAQADVTNLDGQLDAQKILTSDAKGEVADEKNVIAADKTELIETIKADNAACNLRVDQQASKDRKRGFWVALVAAVAGGFLGHAL